MFSCKLLRVERLRCTVDKQRDGQLESECRTAIHYYLQHNVRHPNNDIEKSSI